MRINSIKEWCDMGMNTLLRKEEEVILLIQQKETEITYGTDKDVNLTYIAQYNIPAHFRGGNGGCIVHSKGNITFAINYYMPDYGKKLLSAELCEAFVKWLQSKGINAVNNNNDIMIDGYKVASGVDSRGNPNFWWCFSGFQININNDLKTIKAVCQKEMVKVPKALSDWGVTSDEAYKFCLDWLNKIGKKI